MPDTLVVRRRPPRGTAPGGAVVYALEDIASPPGEDARASVVVTRDGAVAHLSEPVTASPADGDRLVAEVLDALRAEGCARVRRAGVADQAL